MPLLKQSYEKFRRHIVLLDGLCYQFRTTGRTFAMRNSANELAEDIHSMDQFLSRLEKDDVVVIQSQSEVNQASARSAEYQREYMRFVTFRNTLEKLLGLSATDDLAIIQAAEELKKNARSKSTRTRKPRRA